jgi:alkylation response protein AidB-like acyl-CoA dehydrogenase
MAAGEISAFALTEHEVGSDPARMSTTATLSEDGNHYYINGTKLWITNGTDATILVVMANIPGKIVNGKERMQITTFLVEKDMPGFEVEYKCHFMGLKAIGNGVLRFNNVKVPKENMIGKPGDGLRIALTTLYTGRLGLPSSSTGGAKKVIQETERWINERIQWGVPIGKHQSIARYAANITSDAYAMEAITWLAASYADRGSADIRLEAAAAKFFCTETSWRIIDDFIQVRGGRGYETAASLHGRGEHAVPAERWLRDSRIGRIFEGSTQVMYLIMGREAMDTHFKLVMPILQPKPGQKESKMQLMMTAAKFYAKWYPGLYFPSATDFNVKYLSPTNQSQLRYIEKTTRKLARVLFHTMAKYKEKLEFEQCILGNFVEIGVDLFAMAAVLGLTEAKLSENPADQSPQELADLFCNNARVRIARNFRAVGHNHNHSYDKVTETLMNGEFKWIYGEDVYTDDAPEFRGAAQAADAIAKAAAQHPVAAK